MILEERITELQQLFTSSHSENEKKNSNQLFEMLKEFKQSNQQLQIEISYLNNRIKTLEDETNDIRNIDQLKADWNEYEKELQIQFTQTRVQLEKEKIRIKIEKEKILNERTHFDEKVNFFIIFIILLFIILLFIFRKQD